MEIDITGQLYKCQQGYRGGKEYYGNQIFEKRLKERYNYYKELCKNCVIIDYCDSASCKGSCRFYRSWDKEIRENAAKAETGRLRTPEATIKNTLYRPTPRRSVQVDDTPVRKLFLSHESSQHPQATPYLDEVITTVKEEADTEPLREEDKPL